MALLSDARSGVVVRTDIRRELGTDYCKDCSLPVEERINPTAAVAVRKIHLEFHTLGAIGPNGPTTWIKEFLVCFGFAERRAGVPDDAG